MDFSGILGAWGSMQDWLNQFPGPWNLFGAIQYPTHGASHITTGNTSGLASDVGKVGIAGIDPVQILLGAILLIGVLSLVFGDKTASTIVATTTKAASGA